MNPDFDKQQPYPLMLFPKGDPREAHAIAEDAEADKALRAQGYRSLTDSGMHPDQFRDAVDPEPTTPHETAPQPTKRGPGRPRKES